MTAGRESESNLGKTLNSDHLVILVHGIRTHASYYAELREVLRDHKFVVAFTNYGRFDLFRFMFPLRAFRQGAVDKVWRQIEAAIDSHSTASKLSVIAHSFGTYIVGELIKQKPRFRVLRLVMCGSVLPYDADFQNCSHKFTSPILNEVGTKDFWPVIAQSVTVGYGSAGTYGFRNAPFEDRWHNGLAHSDFNNVAFCKKYWIPFLESGTVVPGDTTIEQVPWYISIANIIPLRYVAVAVGLTGMIMVWVGGTSSTCNPETLTGTAYTKCVGKD